jgi:hypothetical protein
VSLEQMRGWIGEGRITEATQVFRSDQEAWREASAFTELGLAAAAPAPAPETPAPAPVRAVAAHVPTARAIASASAHADPALLEQIKSGAGWFYWIAGLSLINTLVSLTGAQWGFIFGLGITQVFDAIANSAGGAGKIIALALDVIVMGMFVLFGYFASRRRNWAFVLGMLLYGLDGLIFLPFKEYLPFGVHVFALFCIFRGFQASRALKSSHA